MIQVCDLCFGQKKYRGLGMIMTDCKACEEKEAKEACEEKESRKVIDRNSGAYKSAIKKIMSADTSITRADAVKLFETEFNKND